jgi:iron complex outermembrane receptor protein
MVSRPVRSLVVPSALLGFVVLSGVFAGQPRLYAQTGATGALIGTVSDSSGGVLPGTTVTATHMETGIVQTATTDEHGRYRIPLLPLGEYRVEASLQGFTSQVHTGVVLTVGTTQELNFTLPLGQMVESVTVTARRREEDVQLVPLVVQVLSADELSANNIQTMEDLTAIVPGMNVLGGMTHNVITIRGQGSGTLSSTTGSYFFFNEVPTPTTSLGGIVAGGGLQYDTASVQVLKGPQGTLFGRNSVGGALLYGTKRPGKEFGGYFEVSTGTYNNLEFTGAINFPLGDIGGVRLAGDSHKREGYVRMLPTSPPYNYAPNGIDLQNVDYQSFRVSVDLFPTNRFSNQFTFQFMDGSTNGESRQLVYTLPTGSQIALFPQLAALALQQQALGPRVALPLSVPPGSFHRFRYLTDNTKYIISDKLNFVNNLGWMWLIANENPDNDSTNLPISDTWPETVEFTKQFSWEPRFEATLFNNRLDLTAGFFYLDRPPQDTRPLGRSRTNGVELYNLNTNGESSTAVFSQATVKLLEKFSLTGGIRRTKDFRSASTRSIILDTATCQNPRPNLLPDCSLNFQGTWYATTNNLSADYNFSSGGLVYVASRRGYRQGGFNNLGGTNLTNPADQLFGPEYVRDYEVGAKNIWRIGSRGLRTNGAVFKQDYTDIQISVTELDPVTGQNISLTRNVGAAIVKGAELETSFDIIPALQVGANFAWLDFHFTKFPANQEAALRRTETTNRPKFAYSLDARYTLPLSPRIGRVSVLDNWHWQTETGNYSDLLFSQTGAYPAFGTGTLNIKWENIYRSPIDLTLIGTNIFDKLYPLTAFGNAGLNGVRRQSYNEPRMIVLRLGYRFGVDAKR